MINWKAIRYFKSSEFDDPSHPGSGDSIDGVLLVLLCRLRADTGWPMIITSAVDIDGSHGHAEKSLHRLDQGCKAVDFFFKTILSTREQVYAVMRVGFGGLGIYYDWGIPIGFHVDIRPKEWTQLWRREDGKYVYLLR